MYTKQQLLLDINDLVDKYIEHELLARCCFYVFHFFFYFVFRLPPEEPVDAEIICESDSDGDHIGFFFTF